MAANPASAGAAGLAAAAAGAGAGGMAEPLGDVRDIFTTLGMTITQRDGIINEGVGLQKIPLGTKSRRTNGLF